MASRDEDEQEWLEQRPWADSPEIDEEDDAMEADYELESELEQALDATLEDEEDAGD